MRTHPNAKHTSISEHGYVKACHTLILTLHLYQDVCHTDEADAITLLDNAAGDKAVTARLEEDWC